MSEHSEHSEHTESVWGMCDVNGCEEHFKPDAAPYGTCQSCEEFSICGKQDAAHYDALLYWEECREHDTGGYSICINCSVEAFKEHTEKIGEEVVPGEEHCICPKCDHDFGRLSELQETEKTTFVCSINGYHKDTSMCGNRASDLPYNWCQSCCEFSICGKQDAKHEAALLYWEGCREHDTGGYSICISCASEAYRTSADFKEGEERCICPKCDHDFGLLATVTATPANN